MAIHFLPFLTVKKNQPVITAKTAPAPAKTTSSREFDTYESKKHPESPRGLIFFVKFIGYILRDLA